MIANHYFDGANYPVGGSSMIAKTIVPVIERMGGQVQANKGVKEVWIENNTAKGVILDNGEKIASRNVISSAGVSNTLSKLLPSLDQFSSFKNNMKKVSPSSGHACLYVGFNKSVDDLGMTDTNLWIYPTYDHDENVRKFKDSQDSDFPVLYMSFASSKDPEWQDKHKDKSTMEVIVPSLFHHYKQWENLPWKKRGDHYEEFKEKLSQRIIRSIYKHCPNLEGHISYYELSTPLSTKSMANYIQGELYGIDHNPERFNQAWLKPKTPIQNLFLTGQDILTVGLAGALASGVLTCSVMLKRNLFKSI